MLVDPDAAREILILQLARRQHDLAVFTIDHVAIVVHIHEVVVGADLLELAIGGQQRAVVPEANVLDGQIVAGQHRGAELLLGGEHLFLDLMEPVGQPRVLDVLLDVRPLQHAFVRHDLKAMNEFRVEREAERSRKKGEARQQHRRTPDAPEREDKKRR